MFRSTDQEPPDDDLWIETYVGVYIYKKLQ
jgi:hypothetical protein